MNKILVEVSVGELLDKISILEIKKDRIKDSDKLKFINGEYEVLKNELKKNIKIDGKLEKLFLSLKNVNSKLWIIEDDKRKCEKDSNFGEDFIRLSRDVHFLNDTRAKIKLYRERRLSKITSFTNLFFLNRLKYGLVVNRYTSSLL